MAVKSWNRIVHAHKLMSEALMRELLIRQKWQNYNSLCCDASNLAVAFNMSGSELTKSVHVALQSFRQKLEELSSDRKDYFIF